MLTIFLGEVTVTTYYLWLTFERISDEPNVCIHKSRSESIKRKVYRLKRHRNLLNKKTFSLIKISLNANCWFWQPSLSLYFTLWYTTICYNYVLCQEILNYSTVKSEIRTIKMFQKPQKYRANKNFLVLFFLWMWPMRVFRNLCNLLINHNKNSAQ